MFLNLLNPKEKDCFMNLAVAMIKADGIIVESEETILNAYQQEMQLQSYSLDAPMSTLDLIEELTQISTLQTKRIIFLELLSLALSDGNYAIEEKDLVRQLASSFGLNDEFVQRAINLEDAYTSVYLSLIHLVKEGE